MGFNEEDAKDPTTASRRPFAIDAGGETTASPFDIEQRASDAEHQGFDGIVATETLHDPFLALTLAARSSSTLDLATGIAVAFARNPMSMAVAANDLQLISGGRFTLGLGSQVQAHIEKRFSMPWSKPAARMKEYVEALRAIWASFETGERLRFEGEHYRHTLMTPFFNPGPNPSGPPRIALAGVGSRMTRVAGEVADAFFAHSFSTRKYLTEVSLPMLAEGAASAGRPSNAVAVSVPVFTAVGESRDEIDAAILATRQQIAFYGSTPAYLPVLDAHGWAGVHERLHELSLRGEWAAMAGVITDEMLSHFAVIGTPSEVAAQSIERFSGLAARLSFYTTADTRPQLVPQILQAIDQHHLREVPRNEAEDGASA
ncbi:TIGR03617 family F420-dependent LLM class oxidoreductase [Humidisolicoccus flavus]|uniref:TIGR03617 family F420-dependent LLM class oxidoreductase n=1 Tax=Humidisolicoccus flavus TaxID=3111414 RepID=UPI0032523CAC